MPLTPPLAYRVLRLLPALTPLPLYDAAPRRPHARLAPPLLEREETLNAGAAGAAVAGAAVAGTASTSATRASAARGNRWYVLEE